jgi:hypothetical protein
MDLLERLAQLALPVRVVFRETLVQQVQQVLRVQQDQLVQKGHLAQMGNLAQMGHLAQMAQKARLVQMVLQGLQDLQVQGLSLLVSMTLRCLTASEM